MCWGEESRLGDLFLNDRDDGAFFRGAALDTRAELLREGFDDAGAEAAVFFVLTFARIHADAVVGDAQLPASIQYLIRDEDLAFAFGEGVLERVDHELGGEEPQADRLIGCHGSYLARDGERDGLSTADHGFGDALAQGLQVGDHRDHRVVAGGVEIALHGGDRDDAIVRVFQVEAALLGLHTLGFEEDDARDELEAVGNPVTHLLEKRVFLRHEVGLLILDGSLVRDVENREEDFFFVVVVNNLAGIHQHRALADPREIVHDLVSFHGGRAGDHLLEERTEDRYFPFAVADIVEAPAARVSVREVKFLVERAACHDHAQILIEYDQWFADGVDDCKREQMAVLGVTEWVLARLVVYHSVIVRGLAYNSERKPHEYFMYEGVRLFLMNKTTVVVGGIIIIVLIGAVVYMSKDTEGSLFSFTNNATSTPSTSSGTDTTIYSPAEEVRAVAAPDATTNATVAPTDTTAVVTGTVNPQGAITTYWYEYGTTASYGQKTGVQTAGSGYVAVKTPAYITGLTKGTTYYFRLVAQNRIGTDMGAQNTVTTTTNNPTPIVGVLPTAKTLSATSVARKTAVITGEVNPNKAATQYWFEYGTSQDFGNTTSFISVGDGALAINASAALGNLAAGTTYFYRLHAQNQFGTVNGAILSFKTTK